MAHMSDNSPPPSPSGGVIELHTSSDHDWQPILRSSNQVVLYDPRSHALSISHSSNNLSLHGEACPYCKRILPEDFQRQAPEDHEFDEADPTYHIRKPDYFQLLSIANDSTSGPPPLTAHEEDGRARTREGTSRAFPPNTMAEGYFKRFFQEECKLGMGAYGSVYLCQHVLDGNPLGHFAVKKIAVGESHTYLLRILQEVRLLEQLNHSNIIKYHHAWLETCQFSPFGPQVPTLHVLMQWAEGGSLDDFIDVRLGRGSPHVHINPFGAFPPSPNPATSTAFPDILPSNATSNEFASPVSDIHSRSARIRAHRAFQRAPPEEKERIRQENRVAGGRGRGRETQSLKAVHLLSAEEVKSLFRDLVEGLTFLHGRSILHLDLKPGNVLLTWDEGHLIPRAMLSDFGTSRDMIAPNPVRSGHTGTLEYSSPESLPSPQTGLLSRVGSKSDVWSLGMILHKLLFFRLPYRYAADGDNGRASNGVQGAERESRLGEPEKLKLLQQEILAYSGFKSTPELVTMFEGRRLPRAFLVLLESLLNPDSKARLSCERVSVAIKEGKFDPLKEAPKHGRLSSLVPLARSFLGADNRTPTLASATNAGSSTSEHDETNAPRGPGAAPREKLRRLGLPSPPASPDTLNGQHDSTKAPTVIARWAKWIVKMLHREPVVMFVKCSVLMWKAFSISNMCPSPYGFPKPWVTSLLVATALADAVAHTGLLGHVGLTAFHFLAVKIGCVYGQCCP